MNVKNLINELKRLEKEVHILLVEKRSNERGQAFNKYKKLFFVGRNKNKLYFEADDSEDEVLLYNY